MQRVVLFGLLARVGRAFWLLSDRRKLGHLEFLLVCGFLLRLQHLFRCKSLESGHLEISGPEALGLARVGQLWMAQLLAFLENRPSLLSILGSGFLFVLLRFRLVGV